jgi:hypothetical protein
VRLVAEDLKINTALTSLNLCENKFGPAGALAIADALKDTTSLKILSISMNDIGSGARAIAEALKGLFPLEKLYLGYTQIGDAEARLLAEALRANTSLRGLFLWGNEIGASGAQAIAEALLVNSSLTELSPKTNQIGDAGARAIAETIKVSSTLADLGLGDNEIGPAGALALAEALKANVSLTALVLQDNHIGDAVAETLSEALEANTSLTRLALHRTRIGPVGAQALTDRLPTNMTDLELDHPPPQLRPLLHRNQALKRKRTSQLASFLTTDPSPLPHEGQQVLCAVAKIDQKFHSTINMSSEELKRENRERAQLARIYNMIREDFPEGPVGLGQYNDYLEAVEDIVESLMWDPPEKRQATQRAVKEYHDTHRARIDSNNARADQAKRMVEARIKEEAARAQVRLKQDEETEVEARAARDREIKAFQATVALNPDRAAVPANTMMIREAIGGRKDKSLARSAENQRKVEELARAQAQALEKYRAERKTVTIKPTASRPATDLFSAGLSATGWADTFPIERAKQVVQHSLLWGL